jgi:hypothetical protein
MHGYATSLQTRNTKVRTDKIHESETSLQTRKKSPSVHAAAAVA